MNDLSILVRSRMRIALPLTRTNADMGEICEQPWKRSSYLIGILIFELEAIGDLRGNWDHERLSQVIFNLVVNAVIHASAKHVRIIAEDQGPDVVVRVRIKAYRFPPRCRVRFSTHL